METEATSRSAADGLTERTVSRVAAVVATAMAVATVIFMVLNSDASATSTQFGVIACVGCGAALVLFALVGRGFLEPPVWTLIVIGALCVLTSDAEPLRPDRFPSPGLRAGLAGLAVVVAAITVQFAADRRFALPVANRQLRRSALTLTTQVVSAALGVLAIAVTPDGGSVSYAWFFAGAAGLVGLIGVAALGLRRN